MSFFFFVTVGLGVGLGVGLAVGVDVTVGEALGFEELGVEELVGVADSVAARVGCRGAMSEMRRAVARIEGLNRDPIGRFGLRELFPR
jgi:hypothetical protein